MKPFLVFAGSIYYPSGGWGDFKEGFDTVDQATAFADGFVKGEGCLAWAHVVDVARGEIAYEAQR